MRLAVVAVLSACCASASAQGTSSFQWHMFLATREVRVKAQPSWTEGGFGRFDVGAKGADSTRTLNTDVAQLGFDWTPAHWLLLHADGIARRLPTGTMGKRAGLVQAYGDVFTEHIRLRAGAFWLPTSRENVDPLWNSRYTITYSALNSWIGQEVRPVGADLQFSPGFYFTAGATAFRGVDTMGTVLSERGWTLGNRLTAYNETIGLPPPDRITRPIGSDLDHKPGFAERIRFELPERALLQITHIDNRTRPITNSAPPNEPWRTRFNIVGGEIGSASPTTTAAEWARGRTTIAFPGGTFALDFDTAYVLASRKLGKDRYTTRVERFSTRSHIHTPADASREHGKALTVAWLRDLSPHARLGFEYVRVDGDRPNAAAEALDVRAGGSTVTVEFRLAY
ncbi:MAG: hypothetical protein NVSMB68_03580 [Thermoanaerobaculia bacterium]